MHMWYAWINNTFSHNNFILQKKEYTKKFVEFVTTRVGILNDSKTIRSAISLLCIMAYLEHSRDITILIVLL